MQSKKRKPLRDVLHRTRNLHGNGGVYYAGSWLPIEECDQWICAKQAQQTQPNLPTASIDENIMYDVCIIGGGCIGGSIARELSKYDLKIVLLERDNDVSQGASKGNSGIVHAGYDDQPGTLKSKFCWKGNQMFAELDKDLKFGFNKNGSLVIAKSDSECNHLKELYNRGLKNGIDNLQIINATQLHQMEPYLSLKCKAALYSPDAGIVSPYEYTIALIENAAQNGVHVHTKHEVIDIKPMDTCFMIQVKVYKTLDNANIKIDKKLRRIFVDNANIEYKQMRAKYVINCGGLFADKISNMVRDYSFNIRPRLGEYLLLNKDESYLTKHTLFPCPSERGKGVLVQSTLWGNLLIGPTSRYFKERRSKDEIIKFLFWRSKELIPSIDGSKIIHSFAGSRPKSDKGWIVEQSKVCDKFFNVAGIDSPGLASSPAIGYHVVYELLQKAGLRLTKKKNWKPNRRPMVFPKRGWKGLKLKKFNGVDAKDEDEMKRNVVCKCERVTEYEIHDCMNRCGVTVNTTQAIRRRTRAGMGQCQGQYCEKYVAEIIAKKYNLKQNEVATRSWPATSLLDSRWLNEKDKKYLERLAQATDSKL
eukprot:93771_1